MEFVMIIVIGILFMAATYLNPFQKSHQNHTGNRFAESWCTFAHPDDGWTRRNFPASSCGWRDRLCGSVAASTYFDSDCHQFRCDSFHPCHWHTGHMLYIKTDNMNLMRGNDEHD